MIALNPEAEKAMAERFGKDTVLALATVENGVPHVRNVNAYYENGAFYIITYALSGKMRHIESNPRVAVAGEWFTGHGKGINLGHWGKKKIIGLPKRLSMSLPSGLITDIMTLTIQTPSFYAWN